MVKKQKEIAYKVFDGNTENYNIQKCIEELQELSLVLTQQLNKPNKDYHLDIIDEIGDVKIRIWYLERKYTKKLIKLRIKNKLKKLIDNVINRRHSNK
tara:strand:- start:4696 stop:4989 length:294 start_codon:yes stop_codon:yes gene_type:complete